MSLRGILYIMIFRGRILFLVFYEMFQRFNFYGFQAIMFLYLKHELDLQLHNAIGVYHVYVGLSCLVSLIGTLIADLYMNKVLSLILMAFFALIGNILIVVASSASEEWNVTKPILDYVGLLVTFGLLLRALGGGGAREIIRSLGDDQFQLPEEKTQLLSFHQMLHYFMMFGTIMAFTIPPVLRMHLECFGQLYCFPAAFGFPAVFMLLGTVIVIGGYSRLKQNIPRDSGMVEFTLCVLAALGNCFGGGEHWIDNASHAYKDEFLDEMQETLAVLWLFIPLPIFWALYEQSGSLWVHQATHMKGTIDRDNNWYVEPDNMQVIIPVVIFILMPIFEHLLIPLWARFRFVLSTVKTRMFVGCVLAILAFVAAGLVEMKNEPTHVPKLVPGEGEFAMWNMFGACPMQVTTNYPDLGPFTVDPLGQYIAKNVPVTGAQPFTYHITAVKTELYNCTMAFDYYGNSSLVEMHTVGIVNLYYIITVGANSQQGSILTLPIDVHYQHSRRCDLQLPLVGIIYYTASGSTSNSSKKDLTQKGILPHEIVWQGEWKEKGFVRIYLDPNHYKIDFFHARPTNYDVKRLISTQADKKQRVPLSRGEVGFLMVKTLDFFTYNYSRVHHPVTVNIGWQVPQYLLISVAAFLYPITLLEYSYSQVSLRMKPVLTSFWYISIGLGNFLVAIFSFSNLFERQLWYYVLYGALMLPNCFVLLVLLFNYMPSQESVAERERGKKEKFAESSSESNLS